MAEKKEEMKDEVRKETNAHVSEEETPNYLKFKVPYRWEDKTYEGLDMSGLENVTTDQIYSIQMRLASSGFISSTPELETEYCCLFTAEACNLPYEFFNKLPARDGVQIRARVTNFLFSTD